MAVYVPAVKYDGALIGSMVLVDFAVELQQRKHTLWYLVVWPGRELIVGNVVDTPSAETGLQWRGKMALLLNMVQSLIN